MKMLCWIVRETGECGSIVEEKISVQVSGSTPSLRTGKPIAIIYFVTCSPSVNAMWTLWQTWLSVPCNPEDCQKTRSRKCFGSRHGGSTECQPDYDGNFGIEKGKGEECFDPNIDACTVSKILQLITALYSNSTMSAKL